jgi:flagellar protein FlaG
MPIDNIAQLSTAQTRAAADNRPQQSGSAEKVEVQRQSLPGSGEVLPQTAQAVKSIEASQTASRLSDFVQSMRRDLQFRVDEDTNKVVVSVVNPETGEIIRQIPSEELMSVARTLGQLQGLLIDTKA